MSKYTTQVRWIVEQAEKEASPKYEYTPGIYTQASYRKLGIDGIDFADTEHNKKLKDKIIDHFYFREIGFETVGIFAWEMRRTINEIMPYYQQLELTLQEITDPLNDINVEYKDKSNTSNDTLHNGTANTDITDKTIYSDTPMSMLGTDDIKNGKYATNATYSDGFNSSADYASDHFDGRFHRTHTEIGHRKSQAKLLQEWRKSIINIDKQFIEELENLFMFLW